MRARSPLRCRAVVIVLAGALLAAAPDARLTDSVQILVLSREVVALDAGGGRGPRVPLELGERVHWQGARGRVGVVLTDRRVLAVTPTSASWQESRYRLREDPPLEALLGERVALVVTGTRAIGFDGHSGNLVEKSLGPGERVLAQSVAENVGVVATDRRALGVSPFAGGFYETPLLAGEEIRTLVTTGDLATLRTSLRLLSFRAPTGRWAVETLGLHDR